MCQLQIEDMRKLKYAISYSKKQLSWFKKCENKYVIEALNKNGYQDAKEIEVVMCYKLLIETEYVIQNISKKAQEEFYRLKHTFDKLRNKFLNH
jgi:hypothetical protein